MKIHPFRIGIIAATVFAALGLSAALLPARASIVQTNDVKFGAPTDFIVTHESGKYIEEGIAAFEKRDFPRSVAMNKAALRLKPTGKTAVAAQSNLCATWAMLDAPMRAEIACKAALALDPNYGPAQSNRDLLEAKRTPE